LRCHPSASRCSGTIHAPGPRRRPSVNRKHSSWHNRVNQSLFLYGKKYMKISVVVLLGWEPRVTAASLCTHMEDWRWITPVLCGILVILAATLVLTDVCCC
ncbi:unnamed protein product, partial [Meganyctiphanes norvegica]